MCVSVGASQRRHCSRGGGRLLRDLDPAALDVLVLGRWHRREPPALGVPREELDDDEREAADGRRHERVDARHVLELVLRAHGVHFIRITGQEFAEVVGVVDARAKGDGELADEQEQPVLGQRELEDESRE